LGRQAIVRSALHALPRSLTAKVVASLGDPRPPIWWPGYRFGESDRPSGWRRSLRRRIWRVAAAAGTQPTESASWPVPWVNGLRVALTDSENSRCVYVAGAFEPNEFAFLHRWLKPGMTFIDVGANEGFFTVFAAERVGAGGRVLSIEPSSREFARLQRNVALNEFGNVCARRVGASDSSRQAALRIAEPLHAGHNTLGRFAYAIDEADREEIELRPLDTLAGEAGLKSVDVLKIDVEGAELSVLRGAERVLDFRPLLIVEVLEAALQAQGASCKDVVNFLTALEYELYGFEAGFPRLLEGALPPDGTNLLALPSELDFDAALGGEARRGSTTRRSGGPPR